MYKKKKDDEVFLVLLGHGPRPSVRRVRGSLLPSFDPHQRCRLDDCREQSVCPTAEVSPPTPVSASDPGRRRASEARGSGEPSFGVSTAASIDATGWFLEISSKKKSLGGGALAN